MKKETIATRFDNIINRVFAQSNRKIADFCEELDLHYTQFLRYKKGESGVPSSLLTQIYEKWGVSPTWLLLGVGDMFLNKFDTESTSVISLPFKNIEASAGGGSFPDTDKEDYFVYFNKDWLIKNGIDFKNAYFVKVRGQSMEPVIDDRSSVLINPIGDKRPSIGGLYLISIENIVLVKRFKLAGDGSYIFESLSEDTVFKIPKNEISTKLRIHGEVVFKQKILK